MRTFLLPAALLLVACGGEPEPAADVALDGSPVAETPGSLDPAEGGDAAGTAGTVYGVVAGAPELSALAALADAAGLRETLADPDAAFTLFAPSDDAFEGLDLDALRADPEAARAFLLGHALSARVMAADVFDGTAIETLAGTELALGAGPPVTVRGGAGRTATVTRADLDADNGVVHVVDAVLSDVP